MARWEPGAHDRLTQAALELYAERGFEQTTAGEIAERAGVTERTFFRYFIDKREVLFDGSTGLLEAVVSAMDAASSSLTPIELVAIALEGAEVVFRDRHDFVKRRAAVIAANPSLQERELLKLARIGTAMVTALGEHGVDDPSAALAAEAGVAIFKIAFERWIRGAPDGSFVDSVRHTVHDFTRLTVDAHPTTPAPVTVQPGLQLHAVEIE